MPAKRRSGSQTMTSASAATLTRPVSEVSVQFDLSAPKAENVSIAGTFNRWDVNVLKMKKDKQGTWSAKAFLKPGRHEYLFVVDGRWMSDPKAKETVPNPFGAENSVLEVG